MESALGWLGKIFDFLLSLLPHNYTVDADSVAVIYPMGKKAVQKNAGVHLYWPLVTNDPTIICIARRTNMLNSQRLTTSDGYTVILSLGIVGRVTDAVKAIMETEDFDDDINQACLRAATPVVLGNTWEELTKMIVEGEFAKLVKKEATSAARPYGYKVESVFVSDWCECKVHALIGDGAMLPGGDDDSD